MSDLAALGSELQLVSIVPVHGLNAGKLHLGSFGGVVDQRAFHVGIIHLGFQLLGSERFHVVAIEEGSDLPAAGTVKNLHRGLAGELKFQP